MSPRETLEAFDRYLTDRGLHLEAVVIGGAALLGDCLALAPVADELRVITPWLEQQDGNPDWPAHVRATLTDLGRRLGHGV
jgi:hypothetical protein